jgi:hypothetical protein
VDLEHGLRNEYEDAEKYIIRGFVSFIPPDILLVIE